MKKSIFILTIIISGFVAQAQQINKNPLTVRLFQQHYSELNENLPLSTEFAGGETHYTKPGMAGFNVGSGSYTLSSRKALHFDQRGFNHRLNTFVVLSMPISLMNIIKETLSYSGKIAFNNKKYGYTTGMTAKGIGLRLML